MIILPSPQGTELYLSQIIDNLHDLAQIFGADTETIVNYAQRHFKSSHRQHEWLTVRAMLRQIFGADASISYDKNGKPYLNISESDAKNISISHSKTHAVILISNQQNIGVDIELISSRVLNLAHRIAQDCEFPNDYNSMPLEKKSEYLTTLWTVKEAVYKSLPNQTNVDLLTDIIVTPFQLVTVPISIDVNVQGYANSCKVFTQRYCDNIVTICE